MVTDNVITSIPYSSTATYNNPSGNATFENSYVEQWLNQEFLPTLHDYESYLFIDSVWDATENSSDTPSMPVGTTTLESTVGLLNTYEYYTTYNNSNGLSTYSTGYLKTYNWWWLLNPYDSSNLWGVFSEGNLEYDWSKYSTYLIALSIRPVVNFRADIQISGGSGVQSDPYILKGDEQETINGTTLLSTRYSGEYLTFNDELYGIVDVEEINGEKLTKITAVDKPSSLTSNVFDSSVTDFSNSSIKTDLEKYYQNLSTTNVTTYNMIQQNTSWYLGQVGLGGNYKAAMCATIDSDISMKECVDKTTSTAASIGLPRVGEMFTSQITRGDNKCFWVLTPAGIDYSIYMNEVSSLFGESPYNNSCGARPSMYLKANVVISTNNTGNGTYEYPYSIELSE